MPRVLLGLDIGSTVVKAAVFDRRGRTLASAARRVPVHTPRPGWVERDADATWRAAAAVLRSISHAGRIAAVGVTGCGNGAVFLDARHRPLRAGILASDQRAEKFMRIPGRRTRQSAYPGQTAALLAWLRASEPRTAKKLARVLFWKDFIRFRLTGALCTDFTDAGASGLLDETTRRWLAADPALPPLRESLAPAGKITRAAAARTGLTAGTPVFTGCIDCEAAALGSGIMLPGELSLVAGTWSVNQTFAAHPPAGHELFLCNPSAQPGRWLLLEASPTSAANFDWAARTLIGRTDFARAATLAARAARSDLLFVPRVPLGRGTFLGLSLSHNRGDLLRAVMTGVVFAHRTHVEKLAHASHRFTKARLAGGATHSAFWCQLFADGLGLPIEVPRVAEPGALGAALLAGVGAGVWRSLAAAQTATVHVARTFRPDRRAHLDLSRDYAQFRKLTASSIFP